MILDDDEVVERLASSENLFNQVRVVNIYEGLKRSGPAVPPLVQELVAGLAHSESRDTVAVSFNLGERTVENYKHGINGSNKVLPEVKAAATEAKDRSVAKVNRAHDAALDCLMTSLGSLGPKLVNVTEPKDLSRIARDMSLIANNLKPKDEVSKASVQVVLMSVNQRPETEFETIVVNP